ncbi:MAG TPA: DUF3099 domain-containing protein [Streptosporangiaceae bacterium]|nr:DUF3099 domain-containing protein [Streptosporangiaceae bacterium]
MVHRAPRPEVALVTEAKRPMSEDIAYRQRRYLLMMGIRVCCFVIAIILFVAHAGWVAAIPAVGAIVIPYFAVVFANGGREPTSTRGFRGYEPNLPERLEGSQGHPAGEPSSSGGGRIPGPDTTAGTQRDRSPHQG